MWFLKMLGLLFLIIFDASALTLSADLRSKMFLYKFNEFFVILAHWCRILYLIINFSPFDKREENFWGIFYIQF